MARPVIALLTDFGLRDHYVGAMKGVILGICPDAALVDITHEIPPQDILTGALELEAVVPFLPPGCVTVAVVDPGVGSSRRAIAVESEGFRFVAPDNGLIELSLRRRSARTIVEIANRAYTRPVISRTFEGRDRFAPAAAWLASGIPLRDIGPPVGAMVAVDLPEPATSERAIDGVVLIGDRFGNLVTNIARGALERIGTDVTVHIGAAVIERVSSTYADFAPGSLGALIGSTERLEIAVNGGSAGDVLALGRGAPVQVRRR